MPDAVHSFFPLSYNNTEPLSFVQFRALPSITSDEFEIAIGRYPLGESIFCL